MLQHEVQHWPPQEREIFEMHYLTGLDASEIAMIHSCPSRELEALIGRCNSGSATFCVRRRVRSHCRSNPTAEFRNDSLAAFQPIRFSRVNP
jgi:hypothetical protein